jgi:hypothetical protein
MWFLTVIRLIDVISDLVLQMATTEPSLLYESPIVNTLPLPDNHTAGTRSACIIGEKKEEDIL